MAIQLQCGSCTKIFSVESRPPEGLQVFCVHCGAPNNVPPAMQVFDAQEVFDAQARQRNSSSPMAKAAAVIAVCACLAAAGFYFYSRPGSSGLAGVLNELPDADVVVAGDLDRLLDASGEGSPAEQAALAQMMGPGGAELEQIKALLPPKGQRGTFAACANTQSLTPDGLIVISPRSMDEGKIRDYLSSRPGAVMIPGSSVELWGFSEPGSDPAVVGVYKGKVLGGSLNFVKRYIDGIPSGEKFGANADNRNLLAKLPSNAVAIVASGRLAAMEQGGGPMMPSLGAKRGAAAAMLEGDLVRITGIGEFKDAASAQAAVGMIQMVFNMGAAQMQNNPLFPGAGLQDTSCTQQEQYMTFKLALKVPARALASAGLPELLRSGTAANETAAAASCQAFAEAQDIYRRTDYNRDGVLEYATRLRGNNSLYETTADQADVGLIDRTFALAEGNPGEAKPKAGYCFKVLTGQGPGATGGARSYISNSQGGKPHMTLGYALVAYPAEYDKTGRNTFIISNAGTIYQQDLGEKTHEIVKAMTLFDPDTTKWVVSE